MSKVFNNLIKKAKERSKSRGKQRGGSDTFRDENSDVSPMNDSPRSVAGSSIEEIFEQHRSKGVASEGGGYDKHHDPMIVPISSDGRLRGSSNHSFETNNNTSSRRFVGQEGSYDAFDEEPNDRDYDDVDYGTNGGSDHLYEFSNHSSGSQNDLTSNSTDRRSKSVGRSLQESHFVRLESKVEDDTKRRSRSSGRSERRHEFTAEKLETYEANRALSSSNEEMKRKSKMEKILQLQEKNQRYKDEFRKVQKDRKALKKEVETKKLETATLTREVEKQIAETSGLKLKLSEARRQLEQLDIDQRMGQNDTTGLQKELSSIRGDYNAALGRIACMREEIEAGKIALNEREEQIISQNEQLLEQSACIEELRQEIDNLQKDEGGKDLGLAEVREENDRLNSQLGSTLERASAMVKEREDAIADLLRENDEMTRLLSTHDETKGNQMTDEFLQLRNELSAASAALEEAQDRNVMLEEDVEAWIAKGEALESDINRLRDDVDAWQRKATAAEQSMNVVESSAQESAKRALGAESALADAELKFKELLQDQERRHTEALFDQKEKLNQQIIAAKESTVVPNPQEMMLQKAVADRKAKDAAKSASWGSVIQKYRGSTDSDEELSAEQKRIKELEAINAEHEEEFTKVKSDMVRLRSTYNDTLYTNKKQIEKLEAENKTYAATQKTMEMELAALQKIVDNLPSKGSGSSVASF